jgi:3',5'-nucleoside bisphosphate phosphatase
MNQYRADLHIHSVLSPCGELEMSPVNIIERAKANRIDMLAICDHNSTRQVEVVRQLGQKAGISVLYGAEVTTKEEVHVLCLLPTVDAQIEFQEYIDKYMPVIDNIEHLFGHQVVVDDEERIIYNEKRLLLSAINQSIEKVQKKIEALSGIFIPAHIERVAYGLFSQLGLMPEGLYVDALEFSYRSRKEQITDKYPVTKKHSLITSSDAHRLEGIGRAVTVFEMEEPSFEELKLALRSQKGRRIVGYEYAQR